MGMNDYIMSRESLKRHCEATCEKFKDVPTSGTYSEHRFVLDLIKQTEWIPVSERLPKKTGKYLVTVRNGNVYAGTFDETSGRFQCAATAWMPLPKPYEEQSETVQMHDPLIDEVVKSGAPFKKWLESFNTESASVCFNKIQELKGIVGAGSEKNTQGGL